MNTAVDTWGFWLFHASWQAAIVAALLLTAVWIGRRWPAPIRYAILLVALAKFALPPIVALPTSAFTHWGPEVVQVQPNPVAPVEPEPLPAPFTQSAAPYDARLPAELLRERGAVPTEFASTSLPPTTPTTPSPNQHSNWKLALLATHLAGMALLTTWLAVQWIRLRRMRISGQTTTNEQIQKRFTHLAKRLGIRRSVQLLVGPQHTVPCSFGLLHPVVIVPNTLTTKPSEDLDRVLAHELAHHRRGDLWVNAVQLGLFILWWFHPLYWLLHRSLRATREDCCDDLLLATGLASPGDYCDTILRVASNQKSTGPLAIASTMADYPHPLEKRFRRIMDASLQRSTRLGWLGLAAVIALAAILLPGARGAAEVENPGLPNVEVEQPQSPDEVTKPKTEDPNNTVTPDESRTIDGRVVDEAGKPIPGAKLWLPLYWHKNPRLVAKAISDDDGRYQMKISAEWMTGAEPIRYPYTIWAYAPGHRIAVASAKGPLYDETAEPVDIVLGSEVETSVLVVKPDGSPAAGAAVEPHRFRGVRGFEPVPDELIALLTTTTDTSGLAHLPAVPMDDLDSIEIVAKNLGRQSIRTDSSLVETKPWKIELRPTGRVKGKIFADDPNVVAGVRLQLTTDGEAPYPRTTMPPWVTDGRAEVQTDKEGRFTVEHLATGNLRIDGGLPVEGRWRLWKPDWQRLEPGETIRLTLEAHPGLLVEGSVLEHGTGKPIAGAQVSIRPYGRAQSTYAVTDEDGGYSTYTVHGMTSCHVSIPGFVPPRDKPHQTSILIPNDTKPFTIPTFELVRTRRITGRLVDAEGRGVPAVSLRGYSSDEAAGRSTVGTRTVQHGEFSIFLPDDVKLNEMTYFVRGLALQPLEATIVQEDPFILGAEPMPTEETGTVIAGRVLDQYNQPVADATVRLDVRRMEGLTDWTSLGFSHLPPTAQTDAKGRFRFDELLRRDAQYQVMVESKLRESIVGTSQWVTANDSQTDLGNVKVKRRYSVRGRVVDESGSPIQGATVTLPRDDEIQTETTDAKGRFTFKTVFGYGRFQIKTIADSYHTYEELTPFSEEDGEKHDSGPTIVLKRKP